MSFLARSTCFLGTAFSFSLCFLTLTARLVDVFLAAVGFLAGPSRNSRLLVGCLLFTRVLLTHFLEIENGSSAALRGRLGLKIRFSDGYCVK